MKKKQQVRKPERTNLFFVVLITALLLVIPEISADTPPQAKELERKATGRRFRLNATAMHELSEIQMLIYTKEDATYDSRGKPFRHFRYSGM